MKNTIIKFIGISGPAAVGKSTAAARFSQCAIASGADAVILSLADPIKEIAHHMTGIPRRVLWGENTIKNSVRTGLTYHPEGYGSGKFEADLSVRRLLQLIGTEVGRQTFGTDIWVNRLISRAAHAASESPSRVLWCMIPDVRFPSEVFDLCKLTDSIVWYTMVWPNNSNTGVPSHSSEDGLLELFRERTFTNDDRFSGKTILHTRTPETTIGTLTEGVTRAFRVFEGGTINYKDMPPSPFPGLPLDMDLPRVAS